MKLDSPEILLDHLAGRYQNSQKYPYVSPFTQFHEMMTAEFSPLIELDPSNGISAVMRDKLDPSPTGSAGVQETSDGEIELFTGATTGSKYLLSTHERGRYQPGIMGVPGQAVRMEGTPTAADSEVWWEYGDGVDTIRMGRDGSGNGTNGDGIFVQYIHGNTDEGKLYQGSWSHDNLNGAGNDTNPSGATLDLENVNIFRNPFTDYGSGPGSVVVKLRGKDGEEIYVTAHVFSSAAKRKFFGNPKLPLRQYVNNGSTTDELSVFVCGRQFAVLGRYDPNRRETAAFSPIQSVSSDTGRPLVSMRKKDLRKWLARSIKVSGLGIRSQFDGYFEIIIDPTLQKSGGSVPEGDWADIPRIDPSETAMEYNITADSIVADSGHRLDGGLLVAGTPTRSTLSGIRRLGLDIPDEAILTVFVYNENGSAGDAKAVFAVEEEA